MRKRFIKSEALDALKAKTKHAERTIGRCFIAFVRSPVKRFQAKNIKGYVFFGTNNHMSSYSTTLFRAMIVGEPDEKVKEIRAAIKFFHEQFEETASAKDVHGAVIVDALKSYNLAILEDMEEPRANSVEVFVFDAHDHLYWISYGGQHGGQEVRSSRRPVIVRGCYDEHLRRQIELTLKRRCRSTRPNKAKILSACKAIKQLTKLHTVSYVLIV